jgi:hypothetical protein
VRGHQRLEDRLPRPYSSHVARLEEQLGLKMSLQTFLAAPTVSGIASRVPPPAAE